jgi:hypothetical protein
MPTFTITLTDKEVEKLKSSIMPIDVILGTANHACTSLSMDLEMF